MQNRIIRLAAFSAVFLALAFAPALADAKKGGNKGGRDHAEDSYHHNSGDDDFELNVDIHISNGDRELISRYMRDDVRRNCPPGLAKKNPPCIPPGHAKKWRKGYSLPDDVVFFPVTGDLLANLSPMPRGYRYVQVDKDVLLIAEASKKVIDAVTLLSAVGN
jgi:Ni/Co efflux regulator RcnB